MKVRIIKMRNIGLIPDGEYNVDSRNVFVMGENQSGKTTFVQSLAMLAEGKLKDYAKIGEEYSVANYSFDDGTEIHWQVLEGQEKIKLVYPNGKTKSNPSRKLIKELVGESFDVNQFISLTPLERKKKIAELSNIPLDEYTRKVKEAEEERKITNRELSNQKSKVGDFEPIANPPKEIDTAKLVEERRALENKQAERKSIDSQIEAYDLQFNSLVDRENQLIIQLKELQEKLNKVKTQREETSSAMIGLNKKKETLKDYSEDIAKIQDKIDTSSSKNTEAISYKNSLNEYNTLIGFQKKATEKENAVDKARFDMVEALAMGDFPKGIKVSDDGDNLLVEDKKGNDIPLDNLNLAGKIQVGLKIGMNYLGRLKAMSLDVSVLDPKNRKAIFTWAKSNNLQLFAEVVSGNEELTVEYEDA